MNSTQRSLVGMDVIVGAYRGIEEEPDEPTGDGLSEAVDELLGLDLKQVTPYLSAAMSAFPQGEDKEKEKEKAAREAEQKKKEEEEKSKASSKKTVVVVLGIIGVGLLGLGTFLAVRKK